MNCKIIFLALSLSILTLNSYSVESCPLIPLPQKSQKVSSIFELSINTIVEFDVELVEHAHFLQKEVLRYEGLTLKTAAFTNNQTNSNRIILKLLTEKKKKNDIHQVVDESFKIDMDREKVIISASNKTGAFNGMISFLQLVRLAEKKDNRLLLDCWSIEDAPHYGWRGLMLDESRHFFGKDKVRQLLDWMALYKLNKFHWHLTDAPGWRIEIKQYPRLTYIGGVGNHTNPDTPAQYYTQDDITEIVQYAKERYIEIIPEIDMPGHASAANRAYPEYSGGGSKKFPEFTFNPGKEETYAYLTNILREVDVLFPSQIIHLGGDEVHFGNEKWKTDENVQSLMRRENLKDLKDVEHYFFKRMADSLISINNKVAAWDEVAESDLSTENTIVFYWRNRFPEQLQKSIDNGFPVVLCPNFPLYLDYRQDTLLNVGHHPTIINTYKDIYHFSPFNLPVKYKNDTKILGIQANIWTERIMTEDRLDFQTFPRIAALAETAWNNQKNKELQQFEDRMRLHLLLYKKSGIYYFNPFEPQKVCEPVK